MQPHEQTNIPTVEWLTLSMVLGHYLLWLGLLNLYQIYPVLSTGLLGLCLAFHLSLQHELIHGHPTRIGWFNDLLGVLPISLIYPYTVYKQSHLQHHQDELLTEPGIDPESFFHSAERWQEMSKFAKALWWINMTLLGRLVINPVRSLVNMLALCRRQLVAGSLSQQLTWIGHLVSITVVIWLVYSIFAVPIWAYLIAVHIGHALISLRSFYEHRIADEPLQRIVVVESNPFFQLLFLNNNFHAAHHIYPGLPWYLLPARFGSERDSILEQNGGFYYRGYSKWLQYLFRPVSSPIYPGTQSETTTQI